MLTLDSYMEYSIFCQPSIYLFPFFLATKWRLIYHRYKKCLKINSGITYPHKVIAAYFQSAPTIKDIFLYVENIIVAFCSVQLCNAHFSAVDRYAYQLQKREQVTWSHRCPGYENSHLSPPFTNSKYCCREKAGDSADHHSDDKSNHFILLHFSKSFLQVIRLIALSLSSRIFIAKIQSPPISQPTHFRSNIPQIC